MSSNNKNISQQSIPNQHTQNVYAMYQPGAYPPIVNANQPGPDTYHTAQYHGPPAQNESKPQQQQQPLMSGMYRHQTTTYRNSVPSQAMPRASRPQMPPSHVFPLMQMFVPPTYRMNQASTWNPAYNLQQTIPGPYNHTYYFPPGQIPLPSQAQQPNRIRQNGNAEINMANSNIAGSMQTQGATAVTSSSQQLATQPQPPAQQPTMANHEMSYVHMQAGTQPIVDPSQNQPIQTQQYIPQMSHLPQPPMKNVANTKKKRSHAIAIINPDTMEDITSALFEDSATTSSAPPPAVSHPIEIMYDHDHTTQPPPNASLIAEEHIDYNQQAAKDAETCTPVVSAICAGPSVEIKPIKKKKSPEQGVVAVDQAAVASASPVEVVTQDVVDRAVVVNDGHRNQEMVVASEVTKSDTQIISDETKLESKLSSDAEAFVVRSVPPPQLPPQPATADQNENVIVEVSVVDVPQQAPPPPAAVVMEPVLTEKKEPVPPPVVEPPQAIVNLTNDNIINNNSSSNEETEKSTKATVDEIIQTINEPAVTAATTTGGQAEPPSSGRTTDEKAADFDDNKNVIVESTNTATTTQQKPEVTQTTATQAPIPKKSQSLTLLIDYEADQWSPDNPEGRKKYSKHQLIKLKDNAPAKEKPTTIPDSLENILSRSTSSGNYPSKDNNQFHMGKMIDMNHLLPKFASGGNNMGGGGGGGQHRAPYTKRSSQQGSQGGNHNNKSQQGHRNDKNGKPIKLVQLNLNDEVQLNTSANAWRPRSLYKEDMTPNDVLFKAFRSILNKLTPENFEVLVCKVKDLKIETEEQLAGLIRIMFEKAIDEPNYAEAYCRMCKEVGTIMVESKDKKVNFRSRLLAICQEEFEKHSTERRDQIKIHRAAASEPGVDEETKILHEEYVVKIRRRANGIAKFIGELFKKQMLTTNIMHACLKGLLTDNHGVDEESIECVCKLMSTIGDHMERSDAGRMDEYIDLLQKVYDRKIEIENLSSRVRFMILDTIDNAKSNWKGRGINEQNPKTMNQIARDVENEQNQINMINYQHPQRRDGGGGGRDNDMNRGSNRNSQRGNNNYNSNQYNQNQGGRSSNQGGKGRMTTDDDGFQQISTRNNNRPVQIDLKKITTSNNSEMTQLGAANRYQGWHNSNNKFAALNDESLHGASGSSQSNKNSMERDRYNRYGSSNSQNDSRMTNKDRSSMDTMRHDISTRSLQLAPPNVRPQQSQQHAHDQRHTASSATTSREAAPVAPPPRKVETVKYEEPDEVTDRIINILKVHIEGFGIDQDFEGLMEHVQKCKREHYWAILLSLVRDNVELKETTRKNAAEFIVQLFQNKEVLKPEVMHALKTFIADAEDYLIDIPFLWQYFSTFIVPLMHKRILKLTDVISLQEILSDKQKFEYLKHVLTAFEKAHGQEDLMKIWSESNVAVTNVLCVSDKEKQANFLKAIGLEWLEKSQPRISANQFADKLKDKVRSKMPNQDITKFIDADSSQNKNSNEFIRLLTTTVLEVCIDERKKLDETQLQSCHDILTKYIDRKVEKELQVLFAIQRMIVQLEHPQGLLFAIFNNLFNHGIVVDGFGIWKTSTEEPEGKGVCLKSTRQFFTEYEENDSDDNNSDDNS